MNTLKTAFRALRRDRFYSFLNIGGLAVGMTVALFILLWVKDEWTFDRFHSKGDRIYQIYSHFSDGSAFEASAYPLGDFALEQAPQIENIVRIQKSWNDPVFKTQDKLLTIDDVAYTDGKFFQVFDFEVLSGNPNTVLESTEGIVLTESTALNLFGRTNILGQSLEVDGELLSVGAIIADFPSNSSLQYNALIPNAVNFKNPDSKANAMQWNNFNYTTFALLKPETTTEGLADLLSKISTEQKGSESLVGLQALRDTHWENLSEYPAFERGDLNSIYVFLSIGLLILLVACINYVNLSTARSNQRVKEISMKKIMGARQKHLFRQFMGETLLISSLTLVIALVLISFFLPFFNQIAGKRIHISLSDVGLWGVVGGALLLTTLLTGLYPSLLFAAKNPLQLIQKSKLPKGFSVYLRKGLVILQFTFSMVLMVCTLIIGQQNRYVHQKDVGFAKEAIFSFNVKAPNQFFGGPPAYSAVLKEELEKESSVLKVSTISQPVYNVTSTHSGSLDWDGRAPEFEPRVTQFSIDESFAEVFDVELVEGRWFQPKFKMDSANVILNETAIRQFGIEDPLGKRFSFRGAEGQIVGVVKDFNYKSIHEPIAPMVIFRDAGWYRRFYVRFNTGQTAEALAASQRLLAQHGPEIPFEPIFVNEAFEKIYEKEAKTNRLFQLFAFLAIFISCLGLFGLTTFHTERRGKEIGIRKVLGASISSIISLLGKEFLLLIGIAVLVAIPIAWIAMQQWLENFAYKINIHWLFFVMGALILLLIAALTVSIQAIKAALVNPIDRLRSE